MGIIVDEIGRYDTYTYNFIKNTTTDKIEVGTDGNLYRLSVSNGNEFLSKDKLYTKADIEAILDKIKAEIIKYEGNCRLAVDEYPSCKQCTDNVFESIYGIFDKYRGESEDKE